MPDFASTTTPHSVGTRAGAQTPLPGCVTRQQPLLGYEREKSEVVESGEREREREREREQLVCV